MVSIACQTSPPPLLHAFSDAVTRKLSEQERRAVEKYLKGLNHARQMPASGAKALPLPLSLHSSTSDTVFTVTRAITRYGITTDDPNKWRYFLDSVEVHLPPFWEQYINDENSVELIPTDSLPLVICAQWPRAQRLTAGEPRLRP